jgi:catechol 2,3-dioxygenase-like lactoylglutathione lyase family enzyme
MSATDAENIHVGFHLEIQVLPVSDVDRSKKFYERLGWRLDDDVAPMEGLRIVQFTPPGSGTSITFGQGLTTATPGTATAALIVSDIVAAHDDLIARGIEASDIWHGPPFPVEARQPGVDPARTSYGSFCAFTDPDGNAYLVQEVTTRRPGRVDPGSTSFTSSAELASALARAESAHRDHERQAGRHLFHHADQDENWPAWYAAYVVAEQTGTDLPA